MVAMGEVKVVQDPTLQSSYYLTQPTERTRLSLGMIERRAMRALEQIQTCEE